MARKNTKSTDAERRARQCERLSRLLRVLRLIMGSGRWDAEAIARELECSTRTVHRLLQTLSMAGIPWHFDSTTRAYKVPPGFKFPGLGEDRSETKTPISAISPAVRESAKEALASAERLTESLRILCDAIEGFQPSAKNVDDKSLKSAKVRS